VASAKKVSHWEEQDEAGAHLASRKVQAIRNKARKAPIMSTADENKQIADAASTATGQVAGLMTQTADPSQRDPRFFKQQQDMIKAAGSGVAEAMKGAREGVTQEKISRMKFREAQHQFDEQSRAQAASQRADRIMKIGKGILGGVVGFAVTGGNPAGALLGAGLASGAGGSAAEDKLSTMQK
tara:strand:+ start:17826 stop:18374 length:549 start_codon:yes stop_codon:yes gene_type:complete